MAFRKVVLLVLCFALTFVSGPMGNGDTKAPDEQFQPTRLPPDPNMPSRVGVFIEENPSTLRMPTILFGYNWDKFNAPQAVAICDSLDDSDCASAQFFMYYAMFEPCSKSSDVDCIEEVFAIGPDGRRERARFLETLPSSVTHPYASNRAAGLPGGGNASLWNLPNVIHPGGDSKYAVFVSRVGSVERTASSFQSQPTGSNPWNYGDFRIAIFPVTFDRDPRYKRHVPLITTGAQGERALGISHPSTKEWEACAIVDDGICALRQPFPPKYRFGIKVRFSSEVNGWVHGRLQNPELELRKSSQGVTLTALGEAQRVPVVAGYFDGAMVTDMERKNWSQSLRPNSFNYLNINQLNVFEIYNRYLGNRSVAYPSQWTFYNLSLRTMSDSHKCILNADGIAGFLSTNAAVYEETPPTFNPASQSLDYRLAAPHLLPTGETLRGQYDLQIDSKVARCIYGFSEAPITASVSITRETETVNITTSSLTERDNWLRLSVAGFTYSSPQIKVKFSQETPRAQASPTPTVAPIEVETPPKTKLKNSVTCVKGKKSVTVTKKKDCPKGFKPRV